MITLSLGHIESFFIPLMPSICTNHQPQRELLHQLRAHDTWMRPRASSASALNAAGDKSMSDSAQATHLSTTVTVVDWPWTVMNSELIRSM